MIFGRGASGGGWLVANVCVRASPITIGMQIGPPPQAATVALAQRLRLLEELLCALLIDLCDRWRRVADKHVRQDCRAKNWHPHRPLPGGLETAI